MHPPTLIKQSKALGNDYRDVLPSLGSCGALHLFLRRIRESNPTIVNIQDEGSGTVPISWKSSGLTCNG